MQSDDITKHSRGKSNSTIPLKRRFSHGTACQQLLHAELEFAGKLDGGSMVDHNTWLGSYGITLLEVDCQYGICVTMCDGITAALEHSCIRLGYLGLQLLVLGLRRCLLRMGHLLRMRHLLRRRGILGIALLSCDC
jgi:hypothetical protein